MHTHVKSSTGRGTCEGTPPTAAMFCALQQESGGYLGQSRSCHTALPWNEIALPRCAGTGERAYGQPGPTRPIFLVRLVRNVTSSRSSGAMFSWGRPEHLRNVALRLGCRGDQDKHTGEYDDIGSRGREHGLDATVAK
jgi:hypothetical protein